MAINPYYALFSLRPKFLLRQTHGFSIIELTIVIILMGLMSIAILTGTQLIREAQTRSLINHITSYEQAVRQFKIIYSYLPGDFPHVETWSAIDVAESCYRIDANGKVNGSDGRHAPDYDLIRGDGDGSIGDAEEGRVNCHLVLGGVLSKQENIGRGIFEKGISSPDDATPLALPSRKYTESYFIDEVNILIFNNPYVMLSAQPQRNPPEKPFKYLSAYQAGHYHARIRSYVLQSIDRKMDDGKPGDGKIVFNSRNIQPGYPSTGVFSASDWGLNGYGSYEQFCTSIIDLSGGNNCAPGSAFSHPGSKSLNSAFLSYKTNL